MHDDSSPAEDGDVFGNANALAKGTRLFEFEIERVLGEGGFAIVYLAFDHSLHRRVALKEYLPTEFAFRQDENTIVLRSVQHKTTFEAGRKSFVQEARFLAQFEHPSLVKVHRVFESNGTAYMVQGYYAGESLSAVLKSGRRYATDAELRPIVAALLAAVEMLHKHECLHRDIAPDNIIIQPNGVPVLLDFGAARRIIGDMTQALTAVLKPSYAPIEQYTEDGGLAQGAWTDVYALAATLRAAITGKPPPSSVGRTIKDALVKFADQPPPGFDLTFLRGIDAGLALLPADRPQSIAAFRSALGLTELDADATTPALQESALPAPVAIAAPPGPTPVPEVTVLRSQAGLPPPPIRAEPVTARTPRIEPAATPAAPRPRRIKRSDAMLVLIGAAALGLMLVVPFAADWIWSSPSSPSLPPPRAPRDERAAAPPSAPPPAPAATPAPAAPVESPPHVATAPAPKDKAVAAPPPATTPPPPKPAASPAASSIAPELPKPAAREAVPAPAPPVRQEAPPKPAALAPSTPPPSTSLIPAPSQPVAPAPAPREEPPARPAPAPQTASLPPPEPPKIRRSLVRVTGDPPVYPREAIRSGIESGRVVALVTIDPQGNVADVAIVTSEPARVFDRAALTALTAWKFRPLGERFQGEVELLFNLKP